MFIRKQMVVLFIASFGLIGGESLASTSFPRGVYVGLGGGYNKTKNAMKDVTAQEVGADNPFTISGQRQDLSSLGITGFLGYLHVFPQYSMTLGGEVFWTFHKGEQTFRQSKVDPGGNNLTFDINSRLRQQYEYGFKVLLGYLITSADHIYTLLGVSNKKFNETNNLKIINLVGGEIVNNNAKSNFTKTYFLVGLGYEKAAGPVRYGVEGFYQLGKKSETIRNSFHYVTNNSDPTTQNPREIGNSYTVLFKVSYNFNVLR